MRGDRAYLAHILECLRRIQEDVGGGREQFFASHTIQDAVIRNLQTLAESTKRLSADIKATRPEVEWSNIAGLRNVLVHAYFDVDLEIVGNRVGRLADAEASRGRDTRFRTPQSSPRLD